MGKDRRLGNLTTPDRVRKLQAALHAKAKANPEFRFYSLYDKVYREDILMHAYACCRNNGGSAGVDGVTFEEVERYGVSKWLGELAESLREGMYRPDAVLRVEIPKANGGTRPLGIPCLRDRVCQSAATLVLGPIFEADFQPEQYAYREGRSALDAVRHVHRLLSGGSLEVVDADLSGFFDSIPHEELMKSVARRVVDGKMLRLIKMWLEAPVEKRNNKGGPTRTTENRDRGRGTPQGAPISPLLSNLYMRRFLLGWKQSGHRLRFRAEIVNYADDFVICCATGKSGLALEAVRSMMARLKLTVNEEKTSLRRLPEETFDFLGYTFGRCYSSETGRAYIGTKPSRRSVKRLMGTIGKCTARSRLLLDATTIVTGINSVMTGWSNYFCLGPVSKAYRAVDSYAASRLRRWLREKHKVKGKGTAQFPDERLYAEYGLVRLSQRTRSLPWAKA